MPKRDPLVVPPIMDSREYTQQEITQAASELQAFKALEGRSSKHKRTRRRRVVISILAVLLALIIGVVVLGSILGNPGQGGTQATALVTRGDFVDSIDVSGNLAAFEQVTITPEIEGTVSQLYVSEGDAVEAGQLLFTLDNPDLDQAVTRAQLGVDSANLNLSSAQTALNDAVWAQGRAWENYLAVRDAYENPAPPPAGDELPSSPPLTQADVDQAYDVYRQSTSAVTSAELALAGASLGVTDANAALAAAVAILDGRNIHSPISGLVVLCNIERGTKLSTLAVAGQVPMQIAQNGQMHMTVSVNEIDILGVEPGMSALITVNALQGYSTEAEVLRVASTSGATEEFYFGGGGGLVTYKVELLIKNPDPKLKIGMSADAKIVLQKLEKVLMVNAMAIQDAGAYNYLLVLDENGSVREVRVKLVASSNALAVIEGDIREGDEVLLDTGYPGGPMMQQDSAMSTSVTISAP